LTTRTKKTPAYRSGTKGYQRSEEAAKKLPVKSYSLPAEIAERITELAREWECSASAAVVRLVEEHDARGKRGK
jgi:hypothetical protein